MTAARPAPRRLLPLAALVLAALSTRGLSLHGQGTDPVTLDSISVSPSAIPLSPGQNTTFQAIAHFSDGSTQLLPSAGNGGSTGPNRPIWSVQFVSSQIDVSACATAQYPAPLTFSSQAIEDVAGIVHETWSPGTPVVTVDGGIDANDVALTLVCTNGAASGAINAHWTGTRYTGTFSFNGGASAGTVNVTGWSRQAPMPASRFSLTAATVNGIVYALGGGDPSAPAPVYAYNPATDVWTTVGSMPTPREGPGAAAIAGLIYVAGGHISNDVASGVFESYEPSTNSWATLAPMPTPRAHLAVVTDGTYVYALGGDTISTNAGVVATVERYDPSSDSWSTLAPMPSPGNFFTAGVLGGTIVVAGSGGSSSPSNATDLYDIATNTWHSGAPMPAARSLMTSGVANGGLYVFGGTVNGSPAYDTWVYYPAVPPPALNAHADYWSGVGSMLTARSQLGAAVVGDVIYALGGMVPGSNPTVEFDTNEALSTPPVNTYAPGGSGSGGGFNALPTVQWQSTNPSIAGIDAGGNAHANMPGQTTIVAVASNGMTCASAGSCATLTVADTMPPFLSLPNSMAIEANNASGANFTYFASANDSVDGSVPVTCDRPSGSTFPFGPTTVHCSASDSSGNTANGSFTITVQDTHAPFLNLPGSQAREANSAGGAVVTYFASANDSVDGSVPVTCDRPSGSTFPFGPTLVNCSASDSHGNTANGSFTITVQDTHAPFLNLPGGQTREATSAAGADVSFTATANDSVDGSRPVICNPASGSTFGLGPTTVNCSATDTHGNTATGSFTITVQDTTPPVLTVPANIVVTATTPAGAPVTFAPTAADLVDGARAVACAPASGSTFAIGTTTVSCSAGDTRGNSASASFTVTVNAAPVDVPGRMTGDFTIDDGDAKHVVEFRVQERVSGAEAGALHYRVRTKRPGRDREDEFESSSLTSVSFSNEPGVSPGRRPASGVDTVAFAGIGRWNGGGGYTFTAVAIDAGEPGRGRDSFAITISDGGGRVVAAVNATITGGNIQSLRARK
jgi:hypothetical protein